MMGIELTEQKSALLVEDDAATRGLIERHLRRLDLDVLAVASAERVLVEAAQRYASFDVVILDVHLPGMSGLDLASLIQARRPSQAIVLITGDSDPRLARDALSRGPVSYLLKPFELFELEAVVKQALARRDEAVSGAGALVQDGGAGQLPPIWLDLVEQSYMGSGHARRVGRLALALAEALPGVETRLEVGELLLAAWSHELGRLRAEGADPVAVALEGAQMLSELGCAPGVVEGVRHIPERHDGTGGPRGLAADRIPLIAQMVSVADALEQYAASSLQAGQDAEAAVDRALGLLVAQRGTIFRPEIVDAAQRQRTRIMIICGDVGGMAGGGATVAA